MLRLERNAKLKQFTITFLLTVLMLLQKFGARARKSCMAEWRMTALYMDCQEIPQERVIKPYMEAYKP